MNKTNFWLIIIGLSGAITVSLGAFASHSLESMVSEDRLSTFRTGVRYQMYHTLALLMIVYLGDKVSNLHITNWAFLAGIIIFSGSLYLLVLTDTSWLGAITPIGGVAFIIGWLNLVYQAAIT